MCRGVLSLALLCEPYIWLTWRTHDHMKDTAERYLALALLVKTFGKSKFYPLFFSFIPGLHNWVFQTRKQRELEETGSEIHQEKPGLAIHLLPARCHGNGHRACAVGRSTAELEDSRVQRRDGSRRLCPWHTRLGDLRRGCERYGDVQIPGCHWCIGRRGADWVATSRCVGFTSVTGQI